MTLVAAALMAAAAPLLAAPAAAAPISSSIGLQTAVEPSVQTVQYRRGWRGHHRGRIGAGLVAGAIIGGAIAASRPYDYYGYPGYDYGYGSYGYAPGGAVAYCEQRFRSYDPISGSYLGYDGLRHPCP